MTMSVKFCLLYDLLKWDFITSKMNIISIRKHIVDMDVVNAVTCSPQSVITCVPSIYYMCGHTIFITRHYPPNNSDVI